MVIPSWTWSTSNEFCLSTLRPGEGIQGKTRCRAGQREQAKRMNKELNKERETARARAFNMAEMSLTIVHNAQQGAE